MRVYDYYSCKVNDLHGSFRLDCSCGPSYQSAYFSDTIDLHQLKYLKHEVELKILVSDDVLEQLFEPESREEIYHEIILHVMLCYHPKVKVLITCNW